MTPALEGCAVKERRANVRVAVEPLVYLYSVGHSVPILLDLSVGGMAIQAMDVLKRGTALEFQFPLPEQKAELSGVAEIVWSDKTGRAGLKFRGLSDVERRQLQHWIVRNQIN